MVFSGFGKRDFDGESQIFHGPMLFFLALCPRKFHMCFESKIRPYPRQTQALKSLTMLLLLLLMMVGS